MTRTTRTPDLMRIGDLAERTHITPQTIRYYEKLGLLGPTEREGQGHRHYDEYAVARLERIATLKQIGLSLDEIRQVLDLYFEDETGIKGKRKVLELLRAHLHEVDDKIASLQRFRSEVTQNIARLERIIDELEAPLPEG